MRPLLLLTALAVLLPACTSPSVDLAEVPPIPFITPDEMTGLLAATERPVVVNVWASWCTPCRAEAPLLRAAADRYRNRVDFIGVAVRDTQDGARRFIAEFGLTGFTHRLDPPGAVPAALGGVGVPLTYFFHPGGRLARVHHGVLDERTLAFWIDETLEP